MTLQKILKHAKAAPLLLFAALLLTSCGSDTPAASVKDTDAAISATPVPEPAKETEDSTDSEPAEASSDGSNNDSGKTSGQPESKQPVTVDEIHPLSVWMCQMFSRILSFPQAANLWR